MGWAIRREIAIEAPVDAVWAWVGTPERISRWWCPPPTVRLVFEPRAGGRFEEHYDDGSHSYRVKGTVVAFVPGRRLAIRRLTPGSPSPADRIEIALLEEGGRTKVVLEHSFENLPERRRKDMEGFYGEPWSDSLRRLRDLATAGHGAGGR